jgi:transcriptional regulator with XRE-family HTH domain
MANPHAESKQQAEAFGARLQRLRVGRRLNITQLAHAAGITEGAIRQMESGQTKLPSFLVGLHLADVLSVDPWYLATGGQRPARAEHESSIGTRLTSLEQRVDLLEAERRAV